MRLVVFGCSVAYGSGLNSPDDNGFSIIAKRCGYEYDNRAVSGSSNNEIVYHILNYNFKPDDIVIVCWTYIMRDMLVEPDKIRRLAHWSEDPSSEYWIRFADTYDYSVKYFIGVHHIKIYLDSLGVKNLHLNVDDHPSIEEVKKTLKFANNLKFDYNLGAIEHLDLTSCNHPGPLTHKNEADILYNLFFK